MKAMTKLNVDPSNTERARAWDGDEGAYWAHNAERFDRAIAGYHTPFMAAAHISCARSTASERPSRPTTPATASSTSQPPGSSGPPAHDHDTTTKRRYQ